MFSGSNIINAKLKTKSQINCKVDVNAACQIYFQVFACVVAVIKIVFKIRKNLCTRSYLYSPLHSHSSPKTRNHVGLSRICILHTILPAVPLTECRLFGWGYLDSGCILCNYCVIAIKCYASFYYQLPHSDFSIVFCSFCQHFPVCWTSVHTALEML